MGYGYFCKRSALACFLAMAGCATTPQSPVATVYAERLEDHGEGCPVRISLRNETQIAWDGISIVLVAFDSGGESVGYWRGIPLGYLAPGQDTVLAAEAVANTACAQLQPLVVEFFGYHPVGKPMIIIPKSRISSVIR